MLAEPLAGKVMGSSEGDFVIAEWRDPGCPPEGRRLIAPRHVHHGDDEAWYVVEGTLVVQLGAEEVEARTGCGVVAPRGTVHTYWNPNPEPARYLLIMTPNIHRLIQEIHAMTERTPEAVKALFAKHNSSLA